MAETLGVVCPEGAHHTTHFGLLHCIPLSQFPDSRLLPVTPWCRKVVIRY